MGTRSQGWGHSHGPVADEGRRKGNLAVVRPGHSPTYPHTPQFISCLAMPVHSSIGSRDRFPGPLRPRFPRVDTDFANPVASLPASLHSDVVLRALHIDPVALVKACVSTAAHHPPGLAFAPCGEPGCQGLKPSRAAVCLGSARGLGACLCHVSPHLSPTSLIHHCKATGCFSGLGVTMKLLEDPWAALVTLVV